MRSKPHIRINGFETIDEAARAELPRVVYDGSDVMLVYERELSAGERGLFFETSTRTVRVREYPTTWRQASDFDLLDLRKSADAH
jgi:hypothetical protein